MSMISTMWIFFQVLVGYNLILPLLLYIIWMNRKASSIIANQSPNRSEADYAIIITAYEQTQTLCAVVTSILKLNYSNYIIYIVADKCDISTLRFDDPRVILLRPVDTLASNVKSHFYAIDRFVRKHDRLTIIDSDNLVHPEYLNQLNTCFDQGFQAVQGLREAKNLDTTYSCLDAARDIYYHFYDGKVLFGLGSSATLSGSGMAFTVDLYRDCLENKEVSGAGFDKVLQSIIVLKDIRIAFTEMAIVYDEKTSRSDQLVQQRSRWINTWFKYFSLGFTIMGKGIQNFSSNQFTFGLVLLRPPLFLFILGSGICFICDLWFSPVSSLIWLVAFILFVLGFYIALQKSSTDKRIYNSLVNIPNFMFYQIVSLMKSRKANKTSVATKHYHTHSIDDINDVK
ncbi:glycosyltransferase [Arcticibacter eurypsychrophilus]|uniref:glycosyltransferase n=1 Tax=Arcticibacter eurypsychrophilus TaxID=1434752 RepID=UPI00084DE948|nr:glycosyltransferase [Arcticibacter eurypsychrophilus]